MEPITFNQLYGNLKKAKSFVEDYPDEKLKEVFGPDWSWEKGLLYEPDAGRFHLGMDGLSAKGKLYPFGVNYDLLLGPESQLNLQGTVDPLNLYYDANLREGGNYNLSASAPFLGGTLGLSAGKENDMSKYLLNYKANW